jgi:hypothetical protein
MIFPQTKYPLPQKLTLHPLPLPAPGSPLLPLGVGGGQARAATQLRLGDVGSNLAVGNIRGQPVGRTDPDGRKKGLCSVVSRAARRLSGSVRNLLPKKWRKGSAPRSAAPSVAPAPSLSAESSAGTSGSSSGWSESLRDLIQDFVELWNWSPCTAPRTERGGRYWCRLAFWVITRLPLTCIQWGLSGILGAGALKCIGWM